MQSPAAVTTHAHQVTCVAPTNIALIKYWGKANVSLNTPLNSSLSLTLTELETTTTITAGTRYESSTTASQSHTLVLNNQRVSPLNDRVRTVLNHMIALSEDPEYWSHIALHLVSQNSFPTAAGLASSASGYAAMVSACQHLMQCRETFPGEFSTIARRGSGSACRSLDGGVVTWQAGAADTETGHDSLARQNFDDAYWPELEALVVVIHEGEKEIASTVGMTSSVTTSAFLAHRVNALVPTRLLEMTAAYASRDFETLATITMVDSNSFHACCADSFPPLVYLTPTSYRVIALVHAFNAAAGTIKVGYTFDAGPNAVLLVLSTDVTAVMSMLLTHFPPPADSTTYVKGKSTLTEYPGLWKRLPEAVPQQVRQIYHATVGPGARLVSPQQCLADDKGCPLSSFTMTTSTTTSTTTMTSTTTTTSYVSSLCRVVVSHRPWICCIAFVIAAVTLSAVKCPQT